jgi:type I restriction enzyme S subunit
MVSELRWTEVTKDEVDASKFRLEASVFNVDVKHANDVILKLKVPSKRLWGENGFIKNAHYGGRIKRNYISKTAKNAVGFLGSSEMLQILPRAEKFIDKNRAIACKLKKGTILISRSGTIGNLTYVTDTLEKYYVSEHAIRLEPFEFGGYIYSFLKTKLGQALIKGNIYGAVINQIEPEDIGDMLIPNPDNSIKLSIHNKIEKSFFLRDESNDLLKEAERLLIKSLNLPSFETIVPEFFIKDAGFKNYTIPLDHVDNRLDASYHSPVAGAIIDLLLDSGQKLLPLSDEKLTKEIILPGRFKRHYVEEGHGTVFLGGKQIYELDPTNKKYLSVTKHSSRIEQQLFLHENMIAITCSGTIGKVNLIPKHWENWTMSQHVLRAVPTNHDIAGYLYIWLNSEFGRSLIQRFTYGSVVDEIDGSHLSKVAVPILNDKEVMNTINELALKANALRSSAYSLEQDAIKEINEKVLYLEST